MSQVFINPYDKWTYDQKAKFLKEAAGDLSATDYANMLRLLEESDPKGPHIDSSKLKEELKKLI